MYQYDIINFPSVVCLSFQTLIRACSSLLSSTVFLRISSIFKNFFDFSFISFLTNHTCTCMFRFYTLMEHSIFSNECSILFLSFLTFSSSTAITIRLSFISFQSFFLTYKYQIYCQRLLLLRHVNV